MFNETGEDLSEGVSAITDILRRFNDVEVFGLQTQPDVAAIGDKHTYDIYCLSDVFPARASHLSDETMSVYVDVNFRKIFEHIKAASGWVDAGDSATKERTPRTALVDGAPGTGEDIVDVSCVPYIF